MTAADVTDATHDELEARLLAAVTGEEGADIELVAHEVAGSDHAQQYLVALASTLGSISGSSATAARAAALLEHGLAIAAEHAESAGASTSASAAASKAATKQHGSDS